MSTSNERPARLARFGPILRRLARSLSPRERSVGDEDWARTLLGSVRRYEPTEAPGPFPTAILLHGCTLEPPHLERWGQLFASCGILAYTIDSFTPRKIGYWASRGLVCTGLRLRGSERCRDITTILPTVLSDRKVDRGRINLVGWSHGGWTVTEWMLDPVAQAFADRTTLAVNSVVLFYPYCGIASSIHERPWTSRAPVLVVTCEADRIVPNGKTLAFVDALSRAAVPITHIALEGVGHAFDVETNWAFDAAKASELRQVAVSFLRQVND
jgi:dienelactone hydrolase